MKQELSAKELAIAPKPDNIMECAELRAKLGSRRAAVSRYYSLLAEDSIVSLATASNLKRLIDRADVIRAWSTAPMDVTSRKAGDEDNYLEQLIAKHGITNLWDRTYEVPLGGMVFFNFPILSVLAEMWVRFRTNGTLRGNPGVMAVWATGRSGAGYVYYGSADVVADSDSRKADANPPVMIYRQGNQVIYQHGAMRFQMDLALWYIYAAIILNEVAHTSLTTFKAGSGDEPVADRRTYYGYNPAGGGGDYYFYFLAPEKQGSYAPALENDTYQGMRVSGYKFGDHFGPGSMDWQLPIALNILYNSDSTIVQPTSDGFKSMVDRINLPLSSCLDTVISKKSMEETLQNSIIKISDFDGTYAWLQSKGAVGTLNDTRGMLLV